jgi:hypothetical protein
MSRETMPEIAALASCGVAVPQHVVYRSFPSETVVLNLHTGRYHGLNATAGRMLEALERSATLRDAAAAVAASYEQEQTVVEGDMCELCRLLLERGLIEVDHGRSS